MLAVNASSATMMYALRCFMELLYRAATDVESGYSRDALYA